MSVGLIVGKNISSNRAENVLPSKLFILVPESIPPTVSTVVTPDPENDELYTPVDVEVEIIDCDKNIKVVSNSSNVRVEPLDESVEPDR